MARFTRKPAAIGDQIKTVLESLCSLEINTIVKPGMSGEKMPQPERALVDLAETYDCELSVLGFPRDPQSGDVTGGREEYRRLHERAAAVAKRWSAESGLSADKQAQLVIVRRIRDTSAQIVHLLDAAALRHQKIGDHVKEDIADHPVELTADEIVVLHKAWDLGVEQIVVQTVIHLDGDVMHRVSPRCYDDATAGPLLSAHDVALRTSIGYWKTLVEIVGEFLGGVARTLGQRG